MESAVTIGLDLGKSVFQVHGVDTAGAVVIQRRLTRGKLLQFFAKQPACLVGMEACAAAHHWGREFSCLIPGFDGAILSPAWRDALWARFYTAAPRRQRRSVEQYKIVKRA